MAGTSVHVVWLFNNDCKLAIPITEQGVAIVPHTTMITQRVNAGEEDGVNKDISIQHSKSLNGSQCNINVVTHGNGASVVKSRILIVQVHLTKRQGASNRY